MYLPSFHMVYTLLAYKATKYLKILGNHLILSFVHLFLAVPSDSRNGGVIPNE